MTGITSDDKYKFMSLHSCMDTLNAISVSILYLGNLSLFSSASKQSQFKGMKTGHLLFCFSKDPNDNLHLQFYKHCNLMYSNEPSLTSTHLLSHFLNMDLGRKCSNPSRVTLYC